MKKAFIIVVAIAIALLLFSKNVYITINF